MGIFSKPKEVVTTKNFYFGSVEAESENNKGQSLIDYFDDYLDIIPMLYKGRFIFVGRKGVGKSAIAKYIKDKSDNEDDSFAALLKMCDFKKEKLLQQVDDANITIEMIFEWMILVNIVKLIVKSDGGSCTKEFDKLSKFLKRNTGSVDIDKFEISEQIIEKGGNVNFGLLKDCFNFAFRNRFDARTTRAPFYKLIDPLKDIVKKILSYQDIKNKEYWLLFDDLDVDYEIKNDECNNSIISLLRIAKSYNNEILKDSTAKVIVFIRKDIRDILISKYNDSAKLINASEIPINWFTKEDNENNIPLKKLVNKRIELNFKQNNIEYDKDDPWTTLITSQNIKGKTSFKHVLDFTFYRPRDIITFLDKITEAEYKWPIDESNLNKILNGYIITNISEIKSELNIYFTEDERDRLFNDIFKDIANNGSLTYDKLKEKLSNLSFSLQEERVIDILLEYNLLTYMSKNNQLIISYRENEMGTYDKDTLSITLPKCLYHYYKRL